MLGEDPGELSSASEQLSRFYDVGYSKPTWGSCWEARVPPPWADCIALSVSEKWRGYSLWLFPLTFSASLLLYLSVFYVLSENVISLFPCFSFLKSFFVSKICWEHWRRKTLEDSFKASLPGGWAVWPADPSTDDGEIDRYIDVARNGYMHIYLSVYPSIPSIHPISIYHLSLSAYLHLSLSICHLYLSIYCLSVI